jgi:NAD dependent epimerase/dehydratase family enzyme
MESFARELGRAMHRPGLLRVPAFALRLALGEGVAGLLLTGQRAVPRKLLAAGFTFDFPRLGEALSDLL